MKKIDIKKKIKAYDRRAENNNITSMFILLTGAFFWLFVLIIALIFMDNGFGKLFVGAIIVAFSIVFAFASTVQYDFYKVNKDIVIKREKARIMNKINLKHLTLLIDKAGLSFDIFINGYSFKTEKSIFIACSHTDNSDGSINCHALFKEIEENQFYYYNFIYDRQIIKDENITLISTKELKNNLKNNKEIFLKAFGKEELINN